ncbi:hypothetical protein B9479_004253 [Cryptococcus floricola]|uniref:Uncharacterized protein n=1 Tax=Cryptococcus floricola TaxID=2591691 RepID=A0A5D3AX59_9TREE|nr:hypothetical protein B9479_004253 [Cryptococcus floricola]
MSSFHDAMMLAAFRPNTQPPPAPPKTSEPLLPDFHLTTLEPLCSVHDVILAFLEESSPALLLRVSPEFHTKILPMLYTRVVLNADNAAAFFYGVTDGKDGRKAKSLEMVRTIVFSDPEAMEGVMRQVYQPPKSRSSDPFWRPLPEVTYPILPNARHLQIGWPVLRFFLTPPHDIVSFPDDPRESPVPTQGMSAMMIYAMSFSRMLEDQVPKLERLCVDVESGDEYDGIAVEQVFRTVAYRGRSAWLKTQGRRSGSRVFDFTLLIRVHLQPQQAPVYLPNKTPAPFIIRFCPHADPARHIAVDPKITAFAIYNLFRIHASRDSVPAVFEVIDEVRVRRELEQLIEDLGMRRSTATWDYFWRSFELKEKEEEEEEWEAPEYD